MTTKPKTIVVITRLPKGIYVLKNTNELNRNAYLQCIAHHIKSRVRDSQLKFGYEQLGTVVHYLRMWDFGVFVF